MKAGRKPEGKKEPLFFNFNLSPYTRKQYTKIYDVLLTNHSNIFQNTYELLFKSTNTVADEYRKEAEDLFWDLYSEDIDYSDYMESVEEFTAQRLDEQFLMHYQFELMSLSNLYQVFEQQLRKWLFEEMTNHHNEYLNQVEFILRDDKNEDTFHEFYGNFRVINNLLTELAFTFEDFFEGEVIIVKSDIWRRIRECNLLSNTYKHGSGKAASALYKIKPEYFKSITNTKLMDMYRTTNLERVLDIEKISFEKYCMAMKEFWEQTREYQSGVVKMEVTDGK
ncbi:hypothetical protein JOC95_002011 [Bacillus tianshenii]|uniref:Uncharacterized protein n=1 Tax=Sutcliffiella tianshenii TaxID=1463404 RepID=A0ABS2P0N8_9BACI|nr:hypothetical protein [Bacillus tianshenii]MBM7620158.1 hypothetical protein [Bacillus tianshenii]